MYRPSSDPHVEELLPFWFGDRDDAAEMAARQAHLWWKHHPAADREVRERFGDLAEPGAGF